MKASLISKKACSDCDDARKVTQLQSCLMFDQISLKRTVIIINKHGIHELPRQLPNDSRLTPRCLINNKFFDFFQTTFSPRSLLGLPPFINFEGMMKYKTFFCS